jgi:exodeoxyribonuclease-3
VLTWLKTSDADVLAIQETKSQDVNFPLAEIEDAGFHAVFSGQKTYNGVTIISKDKACDVVTDLTGLDDPQRRVMFATINGVRVMNVYIPNGSEIGSDKYDYKLNWLEHLQKDLEANLKQYENVVLLGDFNIAPEDIDTYDPEVWKDRILCSPPERDAFKNMLDSGMVDTFRQLTPKEQVFSWWDYRQAAFRRNLGLRIDFVLASNPLAEKLESCIIDKEPRKWERPSDHTPVMAEFKL